MRCLVIYDKTGLYRSPVGKFRHFRGDFNLTLIAKYHDASLYLKLLYWPHIKQDFVRHFHVLLPRGTSPTKSGIREFFRRIHLPPAGYQVGNTMVRKPVHVFALVYHLICLSEDYAYLNVPVSWRCSCGRRSVSGFRPSFTRKCCGASSHCSVASGPSWRGSTLLAWGKPPVSSRWDVVAERKGFSLKKWFSNSTSLFLWSRPCSWNNISYSD